MYIQNASSFAQESMNGYGISAHKEIELTYNKRDFNDFVKNKIFVDGMLVFQSECASTFLEEDKVGFMDEDFADAFAECIKFVSSNTYKNYEDQFNDAVKKFLDYKHNHKFFIGEEGHKLKTDIELSRECHHNGFEGNGVKYYVNIPLMQESFEKIASVNTKLQVLKKQREAYMKDFAKKNSKQTQKQPGDEE